MPNVVVRKKISIPMIGTWDWSRDDYATPLVFDLPGARAKLYLDMWNQGSRRRETTWEAIFELHFSPAPKAVIRGLTTSGKQALDIARHIHACYLTVHEKFESLLYTVGKTRSMLPEKPIPFKEFYSEDSFSGDAVTFQVDGQTEQKFAPKVATTRQGGIRPVFRRAQLIDKGKWTRMQEAVDAQDFAAPELVELYRIRSRLEWREHKIATIEAAIFAETTLRDFIVRALVLRGINKKKLKDLQNDLSFSILLNALLPMAIPKARADRLRPHIVAVDLLRKIRNDLVHGNITEKEINVKNVRKGIEGTFRIVDTIKKTLTP